MPAKNQNRAALLSLAAAAILFTAGCANKAAAPPQTGPLPVQVMPIALQSVARSDEFVATIKSRRSASIQPQVDGNIIAIKVKSGDRVKAGQVLIEIDPLKQKATVQSAQSTEQQKEAVYKYNQIEVERQRKLFAAGVTSRDTLDQAEQSFANSKADYDSASASTQSQKQQLGYYRLTAPFDGVVGDIPVHLGDYVSATTLLTTVDANDQLEAYIYIPTEKSRDIRMGMKVQLVDNLGNDLDDTAIDFISSQVDNGLQGVLVKAPVTNSAERLRNLQIVKAKVIWSQSPQPVVPVLAVSRVGGQPFVFVAEAAGNGFVAHQRSIGLGDAIGNVYSVTSGLKPGDKVIVSGTQFLVDGMPVHPMG